MPTVLDLCQNAMIEIGVLAAGEVASGDDSTYVMARANRMLDAWATKRIYVYAEDINQYTWTANQQSRTIGASGTLTGATTRPVRIHRANWVDTSVDPNIKTPLNLRDAAWWASVTVPDIGVTYPSDLYYNPTYPDGTIYLWPYPTVAYGLELFTWEQLSAFAALSDTLSLPPGYEDAITMSLAELLCVPFGRSCPPELERNARKARAYIQGLNVTPPRMGSRDSGIPGGGSGNYFNWQNGQIV